MSDFEIVWCSTGWRELVELLRVRLPADVRFRTREPGAALADDLRSASVILPGNARIDAAVLERAERVRLIQQPAAGLDSVDVEAARARGVPVCNAPRQTGRAVAEVVLLLMLSLARKVPLARKSLAERTVGAPVGVELRHRTLGIVGMGDSGSALAEIGRALGMNVASVGSKDSREALLDLATRSDFLSLHCPLTDQTRGLVDREVLGRMRSGSYLVNCSRGPVVDRGALEEALASNHLGGFGMDTHWIEPWEPTDPIYARSDVVALPHIGGSTEETLGRIADVVVGNVARLRRGEPLKHRMA